MQTKTCSKCGVEKELSEFHKASKEKFGVKSECKICQKNYQEENKERFKLKKKIWYEKNKNYLKNLCRIKKYNMTSEEYEQKLKEQNNVCAICKQPETKIINGILFPLAIDHNHETGNNRGLLCHRCNVVYGLIDEDIEILKSVIEYKLKWS